MSEGRNLISDSGLTNIQRVETDRFYLRPLGVSDATPTYVSWWNDAEIQEGLNSPARGWDQQRAIRHIAQFDNRSSFHLGIFCRDDDRMIGFFAMFVSDYSKVARTNIVIGEKDFWGQQVVQEVRGRMLDLLFDEMGMEKVKGEIQGRNLPSIFNYKALGFTCEGILRSELPHFNEGRIDVYLFGLLKEEWKSQTSIGNSNES